MQPFRYIALVASTNTLRSSKRAILSIMPAAFSNDMEYWKPEHPPPATPMRRPAGTGSCVAIISFTFAIAAGVSTTGLDGGAGALTTSTGGLTAAVAMVAVLLRKAQAPSGTSVQTGLTISLVAAAPCSKPQPDPIHWMFLPLSRILCGVAPRDRIEKRPALWIQSLSRSIPGAYHQDMRFLEAIATAFFRTFGITQPSGQTRRRAAWFLFGLLSLIVVAIGTACIILFRSM